MRDASEIAERLAALMRLLPLRDAAAELGLPVYALCRTIWDGELPQALAGAPQGPLVGAVGAMASKHRDEKVIAALACPRCGARAGAPFRNSFPNQQHRGPQDRRAQPMRSYNERPLAWLESKRV